MRKQTHETVSLSPNPGGHWAHVWRCAGCGTEHKTVRRPVSLGKTVQTWCRPCDTFKHVVVPAPPGTTVEMACLYCGTKHRFALASHEATGVFNVFCPTGSCEDQYAATQ